jgi:hypothetical protein
MSGCTGSFQTCRCGPCVHARQLASNAIAWGGSRAPQTNVIGHPLTCRCPTCLRAEQVFNSTFEEFGCQ